MESAANRLQKEAKGYLDSLRGKLPPTGLPMKGAHNIDLRRSDDGLTNANSRND